MEIDIVFQIIILIFSVIIHEVSHGYAALWQGDVTAKYDGRLTLNPIKHIDPFGSIILPALMALIPGGIVFGWAKPVPYNPYNLRNKRWGELFVAAAGPASNILVAVIFGILIRIAPEIGLGSAFIYLSLMVVIINIVLAVFNLVPIPPLDGSKILFSVLPKQTLKIRAIFERYGFVLLIFFIFFLWQFLTPIVLILGELITGLNLL